MQLATDPLTGKMVALKRVKPHSDAITKKEGFSLVALREIRLLQMLNDKNIVKLLGVVTDHQSSRKQGTLGEVFLCLEYAMSDLNGLKALPDFKLTPAHVQCYMYQLLRGVYVMHRHGILHRDIKPANILIQRNNVAKIADFGISKQLKRPQKAQALGKLPAGVDHQRLTSGNRVQTLPFRAPEVFLGETNYTGAIDVWSCGITMAYLLSDTALWPMNVPEAKANTVQMQWIWDLVGTDRWEGASKLPQYTQFRPARAVPTRGPTFTTPLWREKFGRLPPQAQDLLRCLLHPDPAQRITAFDATSHDYFWDKVGPDGSPAAPDAASLPPLDMEAAHDAGAREEAHADRARRREAVRAAATGRARPSQSQQAPSQSRGRSIPPSASVSPSLARSMHGASMPGGAAADDVTATAGASKPVDRLDDLPDGRPAVRQVSPSVVSHTSSRVSASRDSLGGSAARYPGASASVGRGPSEARSASRSLAAKRRGLGSLTISRRPKRPRDQKAVAAALLAKRSRGAGQPRPSPSPPPRGPPKPPGPQA